jgi:hypothetical protein
MLDQLRATKEIAEVKVDNVRGGGRAPLQFTLNLRWEAGGANEH